MMIVFTASTQAYSTGLVYDVAIPDAEAFIRRGIARRAGPNDHVVPHAPSFADTAQANKSMSPARVKRKYTRRKGVGDGP